jgi:hypothetical protein
VLDAANADMVFYLAGVDVAAGDRYGKLALTGSARRWIAHLVRGSFNGTYPRAKGAIGTAAELIRIHQRTDARDVTILCY